MGRNKKIGRAFKERTRGGKLTYLCSNPRKSEPGGAWPVVEGKLLQKQCLRKKCGFLQIRTACPLASRRPFPGC